MRSDDRSFNALFVTGQYAEILKGVASPDVVCQMADAGRQMCIAQAMIYADRMADARKVIAFNLARSNDAISAYGELLLGQIAKRNAALNDSVRHFQTAIHLARKANELSTAAWAYLHLFRLLAEASPHELAALLAEARSVVTKVGDPYLASYLHESVAVREAQMGRVHEAKRHLKIAASILERHPNAWMQQLLHMSTSCVACLDGNLPLALDHIAKARALRRITGPSYQDPIIDANESHLQLCAGKFASALPTLRRLSSHHRAVVQIGALDGLATLHLALSQWTDCEEALSALAEPGNKLPDFHNLRWAGRTRLAMLARRDPISSIAESWPHLERADRISDAWLTVALLLIRVEALANARRFAESGLSLLQASERGALDYGDQRGNYYDACHLALVASGEADFGDVLNKRALRVWRAEGKLLPQLAALSRNGVTIAPANYTQSAVDRLLLELVPGGAPHQPAGPPSVVIDAVASAFDLAENPILAGTELMAAATALGCAEHLTPGPAMRRDSVHGQEAKLLTRRDRQVTPVQAVAIAGLLRIADAVVMVGRAREEQRTSAALWPADACRDDESLFISDEMTALAVTARKVAPTNVPVLITGETGTGKEILARAIHAASTRAKATFLPFNCSAGPREMIDAQLFGHRRGAFTGAMENAPGVIRGAGGGTLFLDEIGEAPLDVQPKLLRFLESGEIHPVGEPHPARVDVRIIAATNVDLDAAVSSGRFREDLFYRLNIVRLHLPALRDRRVEIPVFAQHYLRKYARELAKGNLRLAEETVEYLLLYRWPGNVRQLANEMRRMAALAETDAVLMPEHLSSDIVASRRTVPASERVLDPNELVVRIDQPLAAATEHLERVMIPYALKQCGGRVEDAAQMLGLSRKGLYLKRMRLGLEVSEAQPRSA